MLEKYKPSGTSPAAFFMAAFPAALALIVVGALYQFLMDVIPFIYASALLMVGYAAFAGWLAKRAVRSWKSRNPIVAAGVGAAAALVGVAATYYFGAVHIVHTVAQAWTFSLPVDFIVEFWKFKAEQGWTLGHASSGSGQGSSPDISGWGVYIVWIIEACVITVGGALGAYKAAREPFCEGCNTWATKEHTKIIIPSPLPEDVSRIKAAQSMPELTALPNTGAMGGTLVYKVHDCPTCGQLPTLTVQLETLDAKNRKQTKDLHKDVFLTEADLADLELLKALDPATPVREAVKQQDTPQPSNS